MKGEAQTKNRRKGYPGQLVEIPSEFEKQVTGKGGDNLLNISTVTGAKVVPRGNKLYELKGTEKEVQHAELLLKRRVVCINLSVFTHITFISLVHGTQPDSGKISSITVAVVEALH